MNPFRLEVFIAGTMALAITANVSASAQETSDGRDKAVSVYIGSGTGGGYDSYGRLVGMGIGRFLPGTPTVVVKNMPGGTGLKVANFMATMAPKDGTAIGITSRNLIVAPMLGMVEKSSVNFDPQKLVWLGNMNTDVSFIIVRGDSGVTSFDDLRKKEFIVGSSGSADNNAIFPLICNSLLGTKFKMVSGYASSNQLLLALERGEINGIVGFSWASLSVQKPDWVKNKTVRLIAQLGSTPLREQADVPLLQDLAPNEEVRKALQFIAQFNNLGRPFFAPPGTSPQQTAELRDAFKRMAQDSEFLALAKRQKLDVSFTDGESVQKVVQELNSVDPKTAEIVRGALSQASPPEGSAQ